MANSLTRAELRRVARVIADALGIDVDQTASATVSSDGITVVQVDRVEEAAGVITTTRVERTFRVLESSSSAKTA